MIRLEMKKCRMILIERLEALSSGEIDKDEYITGEEILPSGSTQIIQQAKFRYSPLGKTFEKQTENRLMP